MPISDGQDQPGKPSARMGRPPVDSEMVRSRLERGLLDRLDSSVATSGVASRSEAVRAILAAWLDGLDRGGPELQPVTARQDHPPVETPAPVLRTPSDAEVERRARAIVAGRGASPDALDDTGAPRWHWARDEARRDCMRGLRR